MNLTSKQECIDAQQPPALDPGGTLEAGRFLRNLKRDEVSLVYRENPEYGYRVKSSKAKRWRDVEAQKGFSVNLDECVRSTGCSILVHSNADQFYHVWEIDLEALNGYFASLNDRFVAQYKPDKENKCHFELLSTEGVVNSTQFVLLLDSLERAFPPADKDPPKGKVPPLGQEKTAKEVATRYGDLVKIHYDPLAKLP